MEYTNCQICHAPYNTRGKRPIILTCTHTICLECHISLPKSECPICNQIIASEADLKTNIEVFQLIKEREEIENSKPYIPPYIPPKEVTYSNTTINTEFSINNPGEELRHPKITQDGQPLQQLEHKITCPNHENEDLEWYKSKKQERCLMCRSSKIPEVGHWRCKHLDYFVCEKCNLPRTNCVGHENIQLKWINEYKAHPAVGYCRICKQKKRAQELYICKYGCTVCKSCHHSHFASGSGNSNTLVHVNGCKECCGDIGMYCFCSMTIIGWCIAVAYCLNPVYSDESYYSCPYCRTALGDRIDCKCSILMRGDCYGNQKSRRICHKCLHQNCSIHPDKFAMNKSYLLTCSQCHFKFPIKGGGWVCPYGDLEICNKCLFYPGSSCPEHPRKLMMLTSNSGINGGCSICSAHDAKWKCKDCSYFVCEECAIRPLYCPNHTTSDMIIINSKKKKERIFCSMCYTESSGIGCYSCPESDYFLCSNCYQNVLIYLQYIYIYILSRYIYII